MKNPPGGPKLPLWPLPEPLFGVSPARAPKKQFAFWRPRHSAALNQLSELIQTRRILHDAEAACNIRTKLLFKHEAMLAVSEIAKRPD